MEERLVHFETLGCKLNQVESEGAARRFFDAGFRVSMEPVTAKTRENPAVAVCVVNTCTVTAKAEQKARRAIRLLLAKCPNAVVIVTGCYAQLDREELLSLGGRVCVLAGRRKAFLSDVPRLVRGAASADELRRSLQLFFDGEGRVPETDEISEPFNLSTVSFFDHSRAFLKIQDGCDGACAYCRIRLARGKSVSLGANEVLSRVRELERAGQGEVVITAVNIAQYRSVFVREDGEEVAVGFAALLRIVLERTETIAVRISSLHPEIVDEELGKVVENPRVRPHFHLSVQSGSDGVLMRMRRPYRAWTVRRACDILRRAKKDPFLACDIIAGFPGESGEDFGATMDVLGECGFVSVHAFPFSPRPGTEAFAMRPMVPNAEARARVMRLEAFSRERKGGYITRHLGAELSAVTETVRRAASRAAAGEKSVVHAVTENFLHCQIVLPEGASAPRPGSAVRVRIIRVLEDGERTGESEVLAELCASYSF